jgi:hypothetical protein
MCGERRIPVAITDAEADPFERGQALALLEASDPQSHLIRIRMLASFIERWQRHKLSSSRHRSVQMNLSAAQEATGNIGSLQHGTLGR